MTDLGTLGGRGGIAFSINNDGQVVGMALVADDETNHAFLYTGGTMYDLNALVVPRLVGVTLGDARAINDRGQIVANQLCSLALQPYICQAYRLDPIVSSTIPTLSRPALGSMALLLLVRGLFFRRWPH